MNTTQKIINLINYKINEVKKWPDMDKTNDDLFAPKNNKDLIINFFGFILDHLPESELEKRILAFDFDKTSDPEKMWRAYNDPKSPVRNRMILLSHGLTD